MRSATEAAYSPPVDRRLTFDEARAFLPELLEAAGQVVSVRADAVELAADLANGGRSALGGLPELKGLQARLHSALDWFGENGAELRGWAPLLVDLPGEHEGRPVAWCWLEGEPDLRWYHREDCGFAARREI
ncbi:MAG: hypothetical protein JWO79_1151 [Actinomycetia bacterium]|nr:hypothetical protein [Actinomycetes bacterium]MDQ1651222.1 hypothetical protein [Cryptosporangiaceae bacterium]MDQ1657249.1 hypothetical protein [Cryptosporangiaceae bacterium]